MAKRCLSNTDCSPFAHQAEPVARDLADRLAVDLHHIGPVAHCKVEHRPRVARKANWARDVDARSRGKRRRSERGDDCS